MPDDGDDRRVFNPGALGVRSEDGSSDTETGLGRKRRFTVGPPGGCDGEVSP